MCVCVCVYECKKKKVTLYECDLKASNRDDADDLCIENITYVAQDMYRIYNDTFRFYLIDF